MRRTPNATRGRRSTRGSQPGKPAPTRGSQPGKPAPVRVRGSQPGKPAPTRGSQPGKPSAVAGIKKNAQSKRKDVKQATRKRKNKKS